MIFKIYSQIHQTIWLIYIKCIIDFGKIDITMVIQTFTDSIFFMFVNTGFDKRLSWENKIL